MCSLIVPVYGSGQISLGRLPTVTFSEDNDHAMLDFCRIPDRAPENKGLFRIDTTNEMMMVKSHMQKTKHGVDRSTQGWYRHDGKQIVCSSRRVVVARGVPPTPREAAIQQMWKQVVVAGVASLTAFVQPAMADLNKYEAELGGEFGNGTALQFGEADIAGKDFSKQDLRRSNFTAADCRDCNFKNSKLVGAYFIKSVVARANFENADLSDTLMDRAVIVDANLRNAILQRGVFTRSDFARSDIYGADFTNALVDKSQQMMMCKYADGVNSVTGVETRKSLNCNSRRQFRASTPSNPDGPQVSAEEKAAFTSSMPQYRE